jgi:hypothetical protein
VGEHLGEVGLFAWKRTSEKISELKKLTTHNKNRRKEKA